MHWDPDLILIMGGAIAIVLTVRLTGAFTEWVKSRSADPPDLRAMRQRMDEIGNAVDTIALEVERIAEAQRFSTQLLAGRPETARAAIPGAGDGARQPPSSH
ncbi:MAG TPA: hypothetical protein VG916_15120 [Gemmatimonadaceae bacterium]|nr:hypothetical protein [Gemmatimonadaceae bacterium]